MRKTLIKRKNSRKSNKHNKRTRKMAKRGGGLGSDLRQSLVTLCRQGRWDDYDSLTQKIIDEYRRDGKHDYFIHLNRNINTFKKDSVLCLERNLTQLQEEGIPDSMVHLKYVIDIRDGNI